MKKLFNKKHCTLAGVLLICIALLAGSILGCAGAGTNMSAADNKKLAEIFTSEDASTETVEGYDLCFGTESESGESYFLIDLDTKYIKFFSTVPQVAWFEDIYSGDLEDGITASIGDGTSVSIGYVDSSRSGIVADYSYGESYSFDKHDVSDATVLLNDEGGLIDGFQVLDAFQEIEEAGDFVIQEQAVAEQRAVSELSGYQEPADPEPIYEEPAVNEPIYEEPTYVVPEPVYEEPAYVAPIAEEPVYEEPVYEEPPAQYDQPETYTYVLNTNTKKIHILGCRSVDQMKESNKKIVEGTLDQILSWYPNYTICKNCHAQY